MARDWTCAAARDLSLDEDASWDGAEAESSIFSWAGWPDHPDPDRAKRGFMAYDAGAGEQKGSYKLPFAVVRDGNLVAVLSGIHAVAGRLSNTDIPGDVKDRVQGVIDHYEAKATGGSNDAGDLGIRAFAAPILRGPAAGARAIPPDQLAQIVAGHVLDRDVLGERPPFTFSATISTDAVDAYYTRMDESTLRNYAADARAGVAFQESHDPGLLPLGRSFGATYYDRAGEGDDAPPLLLGDGQQSARALARTYADGQVGAGNAAPPDRAVVADFYTLPGLRLSRTATDDLILGIRGGIVHDVSVGFWGGTYVCNLCGRDLLRDPDCEHIPGFSYEVRDETAHRKTARLAVANVKDARLSEVSGVYDGATPGACIVKARQVADAGLLRPDAARLLEQRYRVRLPGAARRWAGHDAKERTMPESTERAGDEPTARETELQAWRDRTAEEIKGARAALVALLPEAERREAAPLAEVARAVAAEVGRLRPLADDGRAYRADLIDAALGEGVRAHATQPAAFRRETYQAILQRSTLDEIKVMRDGWKAQGDLLLAGGRLTREGNPDDGGAANGAARPHETHPAAYRA